MIARLCLATVSGLGFLAALIFWPAGRLDWPQGWIYFSLQALSLYIYTTYLQRVNPEVIEHRLQFKQGTKTWDKVWAACYTPLFIAIYVIAGFDAVRFEWTVMPAWLWFTGVALWLPGNMLIARAMGVNPFFEKTVRIQSERGQYVIDKGPYQYIRHPGYLGFSGWCLSTPMLLGSWWAFIPALLAVVSLVVRTALEDRTLRAELNGYRDYARRIPYRLIPGIW